MPGIPPAEVIRSTFARCHTVRAAAEALGVSARTLFRWLHADPSLAAPGVDRAARGRAPTAQATTVQEKSARAPIAACDRRSVARAVLVQGGTFAEAARAVGVDERTVRRWAETDYSYSGITVRGPGRPKGPRKGPGRELQ
jgi:transposase-like protein